MWRFEVRVLYLTSTLLLIIIVSKLSFLLKTPRQYEKCEGCQTSREILDSTCTLPQLTSNIIPMNFTKPMCKRILPSQESCDRADYLFRGKSVVNCGRQRNIEICTLQYGGIGIIAVYCRINLCHLPIYFGYINNVTGRLIWQQFHTKHILEKVILDHIIPGKRPKNFGHVYIKCHISKDISLSYAEQILTLPPNYITPSTNNHTDSKKASPFSINIMFLDSISRHHFYRSLSKTVQLFSELNRNASTSVLDFRLVQAVRSRTFESLQALFMGMINNARSSLHGDEQRKPVKLGELFGKFKAQGYSTLWLEDICHMSLWGLAKDLLVTEKDTKLSEEMAFRRLMTALKDSHIDSIDTTLSSCRLLFSDLGKQSPFNDIDSICFNGRHQHEYFFEYLYMYHKFMVKQKKPFVSFYESNLAHENTGRRVQSLDTHLEQYLRIMSKEENVLTIILSDHGNSYGDFVESTIEGQIELYHPSLFFIVTPGVASHLGPSRLKNLIENQYRLISLLDLHYTLRSLVTDEPIHQRNLKYQVSANGLFDRISPNRTCDDMPMIMPNLCICEKFEFEVANDSAMVIYAHFIMGQINNEIQNQYGEKNTVKRQRKCKLLSLIGFDSVKKRTKNEDEMTLKMKLLVPSGKPFNKHPDAFHATIKVKSGIITLQNLDRISSYNRYSSCVDDGVEPSLCVCDLENLNGTISPYFLDHILMMTPHSNIMFSDLTCLTSVSATNDYGFVLFVVNDCEVDVNVTMRIYSTSLLLSTQSLISEIVQKDFVKFFSSGVKIDDEWSWYFKADTALTKRHKVL